MLKKTNFNLDLRYPLVRTLEKDFYNSTWEKYSSANININLRDVNYSLEYMTAKINNTLHKSYYYANRNIGIHLAHDSNNTIKGIIIFNLYEKNINKLSYNNKLNQLVKYNNSYIQKTSNPYVLPQTQTKSSKLLLTYERVNIMPLP